MSDVLASLPPSFGATREALHAVACYAIAPARKTSTGRIGLRSTGDGFGTPPFDDGSRITVRGDRLTGRDGSSVRIQTVRAAAEFLGVEVSPDPGVGHDLPPFEPDAPLVVDVTASALLATWYDLGRRTLERLAVEAPGPVSEAQLWPEHFDLAVTIQLDESRAVTVGFSPGDGFHPEPYAYVGPPDTSRLTGTYWNAPFGAYLPYDRLAGLEAPIEAALAFIRTGLMLLPGPSSLA